MRKKEEKPLDGPAGQVLAQAANTSRLALETRVPDEGPIKMSSPSDLVLKCNLQKLSEHS